MKRFGVNRFWLLVLGLMAVAVMTVIFCLSQQSGDESNKLSQAVLDGVKQSGLDVFTPVIALGGDTEPAADGEDKFALRLEGRKWAHFYLYALLGAVEYLWWERFLCRRGELRPEKSPRFRRLWAMIPSFAFCLMYACADEFHQRFVDSREGRPRDVVYDALGFGLSILLTFAAAWLTAMLIKKLRDRRKVG